MGYFRGVLRRPYVYTIGLSLPYYLLATKQSLTGRYLHRNIGSRCTEVFITVERTHSQKTFFQPGQALGRRF